MQQNRIVLAEIKSRVAALVDELVAKGGDRLSVIYVIEKEAAALRMPTVREREAPPPTRSPVTPTSPRSAR